MKKSEIETHYDVAVIGGGLAGLTLSALLAQNGVKTVCIERNDPKTQIKTAYDNRTTAISAGSSRLFERLGIWDAMRPFGAPIRDIRILDGDSPVLLDFKSEEVEDKDFGTIFENRYIREALLEKLSLEKLFTLLAPADIETLESGSDTVTVTMKSGETVKAKLLVGADGRQSHIRRHFGIPARSWSYKQRAVTCVVAHEHPHHGKAIEHFHADGPFAVLPMNDDKQGRHRSSVVWTEHGPYKDSALHYDAESFLAGLQARFPADYGAVSLAGNVAAWPLGLIHARRYTAPRMALVADAAHGIHPIAGQGLNLGFRDVAALSDLVIDAVAFENDPGADMVLRDYQRKRQWDNIAMAAVTDGLVQLFSNNIPPVRAARRLGLRAVSKLRPAKRFFMRQAMGERK